MLSQLLALLVLGVPGRMFLLVWADCLLLSSPARLPLNFSALGMYFKVNPWNIRSSALTVAKYLTSSGSRAMYSFFDLPSHNLRVYFC
jgi:hypothetical protein